MPGIATYGSVIGESMKYPVVFGYFHGVGGCSPSNGIMQQIYYIDDRLAYAGMKSFANIEMSDGNPGNVASRYLRKDNLHLTAAAMYHQAGCDEGRVTLGAISRDMGAAESLFGALYESMVPFYARVEDRSEELQDPAFIDALVEFHSQIENHRLFPGIFPDKPKFSILR